MTALAPDGTAARPAAWDVPTQPITVIAPAMTVAAATA